MLNNFDFDLPKELIAQYPLERGKSRLLYRSTNNKLTNKKFSQICDLLQSGDVLILNNTSVIPSCLIGHIDGIELKINLINRVISSEGERWEFLSKPRKRAVVGAVVRFSDQFVGVIVERFNQNNMDVIEFFKCSNIDRIASGDSILHNEEIQPQSDNSNHKENLKNNDVISQTTNSSESAQCEVQHPSKKKTTSCIDQSEITQSNISNIKLSVDQGNHKVTNSNKRIIRQLINYSMNNTTLDGSYFLKYECLELAIQSAIDIQRDNNHQIHSTAPSINQPQDSSLANGMQLISLSQVEFFNLIQEVGVMPLPPYMKRDATEDDNHTYQTVFSNVKGSVAAPTAGLHFTDKLLAKIKSKGIKIAYVTLHIGGGTFLPVRTESISQHKMHSEFYSIDDATCDLINNAKLNNNRIIAVGTTVTRTLESAAEFCGSKKLYPHSRYTDIFIREHYKFKVVDCLITNFHLPKSTLFILICSFLGSIEAGQELYRHAISKGYRFFSYGDACFLER